MNIQTGGDGSVRIVLQPDVDSLAKEAQGLAEILERAEAAKTHVLLQGVDDEAVEVPGAVAEALFSIADSLSRGNGVVVTPVHKLLTTNQAAAVLNVSRPYLIRLLDEKAIPFEYVGTHRRVRLSDLLTYLERRNAEREAALAEMVQIGEDEDLPY